MTAILGSWIRLLALRRQDVVWAWRREPCADGRLVDSLLVRGPGGRRRFRTDSLARLAGVRSGGRRAVVYARVSSIEPKRDGNLERHCDRFVNKAREAGDQVVDVIGEQAPGINEKRRGLRRILEMVRAGKIDLVVCVFKGA